MPENAVLATASTTTQAAVAPLVSLIIPCCGMLEYTKLCVQSILKYTRSPYELIFLDVGSLDGTAEYLAGVATVHSNTPVEIVRTPIDLGISSACQESLRKTRGEYVVLLNNDTIVTQGWLNQLIGLANMSPAIGLVGPMSNYAAPPQLVETVPYRLGPKKANRIVSTDLIQVDDVHRFASEFRETNKGKWLETDRLGGFCLLMKKDVICKINSQGQLDPWTDLGLFDTDILSAKARQAGYTLAVCRDLFIHHFGTRTIAHGAPIPADTKVR